MLQHTIHMLVTGLLACTESRLDSAGTHVTDSDEDSHGTTDSEPLDTGTSPHGTMVPFVNVAYGYDGIAWKHQGNLGDCEDLEIVAIDDQASLDELFATRLAESEPPKIDFTNTTAIVSYTLECNHEPHHLQVDRAFADDKALFLRHTLHVPGKGFEDDCRPYTVNTVEDNGYLTVGGELTREVVPAKDWKWW